MIFSMPYMDMAKQYGTSAFQSFFFNIQTENDPSYLRFLESITEDDILKNPFLYEYYTKLHRCNLPGINSWVKFYIVIQQNISELNIINLCY